MFAALALLVMALLAGKALHQEPVTRVSGWGITEPVRLMAVLEEKIEPGDRIVAWDRPMHAMRFYLLRNGLLDKWAGTSRPAAAGRLFVVVHNPTQTLNDVMAGSQALTTRMAGYQTPTEVGTYGNVSLYRLLPKQRGRSRLHHTAYELPRG